MNSTKTFSRFRKIAFAEGISFLTLLLIAMPLKYFVGLPLTVTIVGSLHGILFIAFAISVWETKNDYKKDFRWLGKAFLASILPFGTIVMDREWKREEAVLNKQRELKRKLFFYNQSFLNKPFFKPIIADPFGKPLTTIT